MWHSRSSFCVYGTEYECEYYLCSDIWPNTKRNIIHVFYNDRIQIKILYGLGNLAKYEYEYYSDCHFCPNTNTNNTEYEYDHTEYEYIQKPLKSNKCQNLEQWIFHTGSFISSVSCSILQPTRRFPFQSIHPLIGYGVYNIFNYWTFNYNRNVFCLRWNLYYSVSKHQLNMNMNNIWKIMQTQIRISTVLTLCF